MTKPDPIAKAVRDLERVLDGVARVGLSNLVRGDANPGREADRDVKGADE